MPRSFDPSETETVLQQYTEAAIEKLDALAAAPDTSILDLRDCVVFLSGCLSGILQTNRFPIHIVNAHVATFQETLDGHLRTHFPQHDPHVWAHNLSQLLN